MAEPRIPYMQRLYRHNLRPIVLVTSFVIGLWSLVWAIGLFQEISSDKGDGFSRLAVFALVLGIMYITVTGIEAFGFVAALLQRLALIRIYSFGAVVVTVLLIAAALLRVIVHFVLKNDLINECIKEATGQTVDFTFGIWGPRVTTTLTPSEATTWCNNAFSRDSWSEIIYFLVALVFVGGITSIAWAYAHQVRVGPAAFAPNATAMGAPAPQRGAAGAYNPYYQPPYTQSGSADAFNASVATFAPPPGPPPGSRSQQQQQPVKGDSDSDRDTLPGYVDADSKYDGDVKRRDSGSGDENPFADFERREERR